MAWLVLLLGCGRPIGFFPTPVGDTGGLFVDDGDVTTVVLAAPTGTPRDAPGWCEVELSPIADPFPTSVCHSGTIQWVSPPHDGGRTYLVDQADGTRTLHVMRHQADAGPDPLVVDIAVEEVVDAGSWTAALVDEGDQRSVHELDTAGLGPALHSAPSLRLVGRQDQTVVATDGVQVWRVPRDGEVQLVGPPADSVSVVAAARDLALRWTVDGVEHQGVLSDGVLIEAPDGLGTLIGLGSWSDVAFADGQELVLWSPATDAVSRSPLEADLLPVEAVRAATAESDALVTLEAPDGAERSWMIRSGTPSPCTGFEYDVEPFARLPTVAAWAYVVPDPDGPDQVSLCQNDARRALVTDAHGLDIWMP